MIWMCQEEYRLGYNMIKCGILKQPWAKFSIMASLRSSHNESQQSTEMAQKESDIKGLHPAAD